MRGSIRARLEADRQAAAVEVDLLAGSEEGEADAVDEDVARERERVLRHGSDRSAGGAEGTEGAADGDVFVEVRVAVEADDADAADELAVGDDPLSDAVRTEDAVERNAAGLHRAVVDGLRIRPVVGQLLTGDDAGAAAGCAGNGVAWSAGERLGGRNGLGGIEYGMEVATAIRVLDAVQRRVRRIRYAGREMHAADEAHRARRERRHVVAEERRRTRHADGEVVVVWIGVVLVEERQHAAGAVDDGDRGAAADRSVGCRYDGIHIGGRERRERRRRGVPEGPVDTLRVYRGCRQDQCDKQDVSHDLLARVGATRQPSLDPVDKRRGTVAENDRISALELDFGDSHAGVASEEGAVG